MTTSPQPRLSPYARKLRSQTRTEEVEFRRSGEGILAPGDIGSFPALMIFQDALRDGPCSFPVDYSRVGAGQQAGTRLERSLNGSYLQSAATFGRSAPGPRAEIISALRLHLSRLSNKKRCL